MVKRYIVAPDALRALQMVKQKQVQNVRVLGELLLEFERRKAFFLETVAKTEEEQRAIGEGALAALGLDQKEEQYMIDPVTGLVRKLRDAQWVEEF